MVPEDLEAEAALEVEPQVVQAEARAELPLEVNLGQKAACFRAVEVLVGHQVKLENLGKVKKQFHRGGYHRKQYQEPAVSCMINLSVLLLWIVGPVPVNLFLLKLTSPAVVSRFGCLDKNPNKVLKDGSVVNVRLDHVLIVQFMCIYLKYLFI